MMLTNGSSDSFGLFNFSLNESDFSADLDILFKPEPVLLALYVPTILISLFANTLLIVVTILCHYTKNVTNMYLVNLSVADLLVTVICMPIQLSKAITLVWFYGEAVCKTVNYMQGVAVSASILTIAMMSLDRWLSITPEPRLRPPGRRQAMIIIVILWGASMLIFTPALMVATVETESVPVIIKNGKNITIITRNVNFCTEMWSGPETKKRFGIFSFSLVYAIPGTITILSYAFMGRTLCSIRPPFDFDEGAVSMQQGIQRIRERKRIAWTLFILAMIFAMCWMPYNIMQLLLDMNEVTASELSYILPYALFAGHLNSAINPVVYCIMTKNFQRSAQKLLCKREVCRRVQRYTWRCTQRPEGSSSDYELYHGPHKKCYLQMQTYRYKGHAFETIPRQGNILAGAPQSSRGNLEAPTRANQFTQTRSSRRTAPVHTLSVEMLHRHCQVNNTR